MKTEERRTAICPRCGKAYRGRPALSRTDNKTYICRIVEQREALENIGVDEKEQGRNTLQQFIAIQEHQDI